MLNNAGMQNIIIRVGKKWVPAIAARFTSTGQAVVYTASGPVVVERERYQKVGDGETAVQQTGEAK